MLYLTSGASVASGLGINGAVGGTSLLEKEQQSVETKELSLGWAIVGWQVSHGKIFCSLFPICFHRCQGRMVVPVGEAWPGPWGLSSGSSTEKLLSRKLPVAGGMFTPIPQSLLLVWGRDQSVGCTPAVLAWPGNLLEMQNPRLCPRPTGSESACRQGPGHIRTLLLERPGCRTPKFQPSDRWQSWLSYFNKLHQVPAH